MIWSECSSVATERDWADAYRQQALAALEGARLVQGGEPSVLAMLLQMVLEKLGKAALLRSGMMTVDRAEATHQAATTMTQVLGGSRRLCKKLGFNREYVRHILTPMVAQLESLNPSVARRRGGRGPWLEYPWLDPGDDVRWPAQHLPGLEGFRPKHGGRAILLFRGLPHAVRAVRHRVRLIAGACFLSSAALNGIEVFSTRPFPSSFPSTGATNPAVVGHAQVGADQEHREALRRLREAPRCLTRKTRTG